MWRTWIVLALTATIGGCAIGPAPESVSLGYGASVDRGRFFALHSCAGCHAVGVRGESPNPGAPPFALIRLRYNELSLERRLAEISKHGHFEMPPIYITDDEIRDLTAYIQTVEPDGPADAADLPSAVRAVLSPVRRMRGLKRNHRAELGASSG